MRNNIGKSAIQGEKYLASSEHLQRKRKKPQLNFWISNNSNIDLFPNMISMCILS